MWTRFAHGCSSWPTEAARDDETATVVIGTRGDVPAWGAEVTWVGPTGEREMTGYGGQLEDLEQQVTMQIGSRSERIRREQAVPEPPPPPSEIQT